MKKQTLGTVIISLVGSIVVSVLFSAHTIAKESAQELHETNQILEQTEELLLEVETAIHAKKEQLKTIEFQVKEHRELLSSTEGFMK